MPRSILATAFCFALACAAERAEEPIPCEFSNVPRIIAVGDVHGAYDQLVQILQAANIIDPNLRWIAGKTHLVQTGDIPDRGPDSRKAFDLLMRLEREAADAGGRVHPLIGNHEAWMILGNLRYVHPGEFDAFVTKESEARREEFLKTNPRLFGNIPLGFAEHRAAFAPHGPYGAWICRNNTVLKINDTLFVHGGLNEKYGTLPLPHLNDAVRAELRQTHDARARYPILDDPEGPVLYRGLALDAETKISPLLNKILRFHNARRIVIGHTVAYGGIETRADGRVLLIDCGMNPIYWEFGGRPAALEIAGDQLRKIYLPPQK